MLFVSRVKVAAAWVTMITYVALLIPGAVAGLLYAFASHGFAGGIDLYDDILDKIRKWA